MPALPPNPARRRFRRAGVIALAGVALGVVVLVATLPALLGTRFARGIILAQLNAALAPGRLEVNRFEFSWTDPTRLVGSQLIAPDGSEVGQVPFAELDRSLGQLIFRRAQPTILTLDGLALTIDSSTDGKLNLAEALQTVIAHPNPDRDLAVRVKAGSLVFRSPRLAHPITARTVALDLHIPPSPRALTWDLRLGHAGGGELVARGDTNRWTARDTNPGLADLRLDLSARAWPIDLEADGLAATGRIDGTIEVARRSERWSLAAETRWLDPSLTGPRLLGDTIQPGLVTLGCDLSQNSESWTLRRLTLNSPLGSLRAEGRFDPAVGFVTTPGQPQRLEGRINLAALARQLPHALRLRPGLLVEAGSARVVAEASGPPERSSFSLEATVADLVAVDGERRLTLRDPATLSAEIVRAGDAVTIQQLSARTTFLSMKATGRLDDANLVGSVDLGAFRQQLGEWINLGNLDGSGRAGITGSYQVREHEFAARCDVQARDLRLAGLAAGPIERPLTSIALTAQGPTSAAGWPLGLRAAELTAESGRSSGRIALQPAGDLLTIHGRLRTDLPGTGVSRAAEAWLDGSWAAARQVLRCDRLEALVGAVGEAPEDRLGLAVQGSYDGQAGTIALDPLVVPGGAVGRVRLAPGGIRISGLGRDLAVVRASAGIEGDLLASDPSDPVSRWSAGLTAQGEAGGVRFSAQGGIEPADGGPPAGAQEASFRLLGRYSQPDDRVELTECRAGSAFGGLTAAGQVDDLTGSRRVAIHGQFAPDFAALTGWLQRRVEPGARIAGQPGTFRAAGRLDGFDPLRSIEGEVGFNLAGLDVYGMRLGPTPILVRGQGGRIHVAPISTTLNEGHIRLEPEVLVQEPTGEPVLRLGKNSSIRDARINDEVSRRVLAFVAPILEGATRASGRVSVAIDHAEIPLRSGRSKAAQVDGQVVFNDVAFAPGPLANDLLGAIGRRDATLKLDKPVTLTIADGRINQSGLALPIGDLTRIELAGWVDFDRNLALTATLPVTPAMLGNNPLLSDIAAGTQIRLPVGGTLSRPTIDRDAFAAGLRDVGKSLLNRGATRGALELLMRVGQPRDPNAPPPLTAEERKALRQDRKAERKARRDGLPEVAPNP